MCFSQLICCMIYFMSITYCLFLCKFYDNTIFVFTCYVSNIVWGPWTVSGGVMLNNICCTNKCSMWWLLRILIGQNPNADHTLIVIFSYVKKHPLIHLEKEKGYMLKDSHKRGRQGFQIGRIWDEGMILALTTSRRTCLFFFFFFLKNFFFNWKINCFTMLVSAMLLLSCFSPVWLCATP